MTATLDGAALDARLRDIRLLCCDVDGVLTDGSVYLGNDGEELKAFNIKDGFGLRALQRCGVEVALITGRQSNLVARRAQELGIRHVFQGNADKRGALADLLARLQLQAAQVAHVGDDWPDMALFSRVGLAIAVADAHPGVRDAAHWVTQADGGRGAVREICDRLLQAQGHYARLYEEYRA